VVPYTRANSIHSERWRARWRQDGPTGDEIAIVDCGRIAHHPQVPASPPAPGTCPAIHLLDSVAIPAITSGDG